MTDLADRLNRWWSILDELEDDAPEPVIPDPKPGEAEELAERLKRLRERCSESTAHKRNTEH